MASSGIRQANWQRVLLSFYRASHGTNERVAYEELVIQAWRDYPEQFSLRNHPEFPDASDMHKRLSELSRDGFVVSLGNKTFRLTDKGLRTAQELLGKNGALSTDQVEGALRLGRDEEAFLELARRSRAFSAWNAGQGDRLVDHDARTFFQISVATSLEDRRRKTKFVRETLQRANRLGIRDARELYELYTSLVSRFGQLLGHEVSQ